MSALSLNREPTVERRSVARRRIVLRLPMPPSVNSAFANAAKGRVRSRAYNAWREEAGWRIKEQKPGTISGPVTVAIQIEDTHPTSDCDNRIKCCLDILTPKHGMGIIDGDNAKTVRKISAEWSDVQGVVITIEAVG